MNDESKRALAVSIITAIGDGKVPHVSLPLKRGETFSSSLARKEEAVAAVLELLEGRELAGKGKPVADDAAARTVELPFGGTAEGQASR